ncbi:MAG TPA: hypothetical protein VLH09_06360 [Bryobacteraceae bacterium]|nr:hypothetical protein [Bryobacteraceae bacterium]
MLRLLAAIPQLFVENPLFLFEALLIAVAALLALDARPGRKPRLRGLRAAFRGLARRRGLAVAAVGLFALFGRLALLPVLPVPVPHAHDEFSYLLAADTFASGRLANPAHPMWLHFETMHVNQKPAYMSMYPPAQGMALAAGKVLFGHPWWGVWLSAGLMCSAICWMLQGWLPPGWALLGGFIAAVRLGLFSYWMNSYWGGAVAAIGGALVLGALPRLMRKPGVLRAVLFALGVAILANSRPYEGLLLALPAGIVLLARMPKLRVVAPIALVLVLAASAMLYYNWRVAGDPFRLPYQVNRETYVQARYFVWESTNPRPVYNHAAMRDFYVGWQLRQSEWAGTPAGFLQNAVHFAVYFWAFFLGPLLTVPLLMIHRLVRDRRMRLLAVTAALSLVGLGANLFFVQHYAAPATALLYALLLQGLRHLRAWRPPLAPAFVAVCAVMLLVRLGAEPVQGRLMPSDLATWFQSPKGFTERAEIQSRLDETPGMHLIVVRYSAGHDPEREWVYNTADIDRAKVVWAREMDEASNRRLLAYFKGRRVWLLKADSASPKLSPYPPHE